MKKKLSAFFLDVGIMLTAMTLVMMFCILFFEFLDLAIAILGKYGTMAMVGVAIAVFFGLIKQITQK